MGKFLCCINELRCVIVCLNSSLLAFIFATRSTTEPTRAVTIKSVSKAITKHKHFSQVENYILNMKILSTAVSGAASSPPTLVITLVAQYTE